ncbi:MAG: flagellar basal body-associated FliL family protein [Cellulomonas sp.]
MSEQRVISSTKRPVGGIREGRGKDAPVVAVADEGKKKRKKPKKIVLIIGAVVILAIAGAAYFFFLKPAADPNAAPPPAPAPIPGKILTIDAVSVNLADGHYLRLGLGLQLIEGGGHGETGPDPAHALDLAIAMYSGHTVAEVSDPATRDALKAELLTELEHAYEGEVMDVYLTDYVTQ